jgi:hypothetical protein
MNRYNRTGYLEKDIVDYNTKNLKASLALHYKIKSDIELIYAGSYGNGTTVYQGDNRYSLKDIQFFQNRLELKKENKFFIRAYATNEDAGKSYDAVFTALLLQNSVKPDDKWSVDYRNFYDTKMAPRVKSLPSYPAFVFPVPPDYINNINAVLAKYPDSLILYHQNARNYADGIGNPVFGYKERLTPGTEAYNNALQDITSRTSYTKGGSRFYDQSALYHIQGEYKFTPSFAEIVLGGNYRIYCPYSRGSIFSDTVAYVTIDTTYDEGSQKIKSISKVNHRNIITNQEFGVYSGIEKKFLDEKPIEVVLLHDQCGDSS